MTPEELKEALYKFKDYLEANDVPVFGLWMYTAGANPMNPSGDILGIGVNKLMQDALMIIWADRLGWKVVPK